MKSNIIGLHMYNYVVQKALIAARCAILPNKTKKANVQTVVDILLSAVEFIRHTHVN